MISDFGFRISDLPLTRVAELGRAAKKFEIRNPKSEICTALLVLMIMFGCAHQPKSPVTTTSRSSVEPVEEGWTEKGVASWYGDPYHGRRTASGEVYDMFEMTAAHKTLPFGTVVKVDRRDTGADVKVRINDRGPFIEGRIIDLSYAAAQVIGLDIDGVAPVKIKVVGREDAPARNSQSPSAAVEANCFWVQVGAFSERERAVRVEEELERGGEQAVILEGLDELWRVRLGPFDEKQEAERARNRITDAWPGSNIVPCGG
jgi:rare lipoprotein A